MRFPCAAASTMALLLTACATAAAPPAGPAVTPQDGGYVLSAPLPDMTAFALVRTDGAVPVAMTVDEAADVLAQYGVIFIGEEHRHPGNHLAQMALYRAIHERAPALSLSLEQFERDVQPVLDDFMAGRIGETPFKDAARAWDNYPVSYRPLVEYSRAHGLPVIAAEAPTMVVRCVGIEGPAFLDRMTPEQRGWAAAQLHLHDGPYKDKYMRFARGDGSHGESQTPEEARAAAERSFAAQVTRDDTMAESIYLHLQASPGRKVVHLNGNFHSASFLGTAERLQLRDPSLKIAVVNPIAVKDPAKPSFTAEDAATGTFVLLIQQTPKSYMSMDEMREGIKKQMAFRSENTCEL